MWAFDLDLWPWRSPRLSVIRVLVLCQSTKCMQILVILWLFVFDLWAIRPTRLRLITWPCYLELWPWRSWRLWLMRVVVFHPYTKLEVRKIWCTMCVSINGSGDPDLWPFDIETGMRVAIKVGNLPFKFGHARTLSSRIIRYARDGRIDGQKQRLLPPFLRRRGHNKYH